MASRNAAPEIPAPRRPASGHDLAGPLALTLALVGLALLAAAMGYVSFEGQFQFVARHRSPDIVARIEALGPDIGAALFACLGFASAVRGRPALRARLGNLACTAASLSMNLLTAHTWGGRLVAVLPPLLYAAASDTCISELRQRALDKRGIHQHPRTATLLLGTLRWTLRLIVAPRLTLTAARTWILADSATISSTDVPSAPASISPRQRRQRVPTPPQPRTHSVGTRGPSRTVEVVRKYEQLGADGDPRYGDPLQIPTLARTWAVGTGLNRTTISRALHTHIRAQKAAAPSPRDGPAARN